MRGTRLHPSPVRRHNDQLFEMNRKAVTLKNVKLSQALKHPTWKMGKKISIDSCTMMNKVFEVIEAKHLFNISYKKITVLTHPNSYIHAVVKFKNGLIIPYCLQNINFLHVVAFDI